MCPDVFRFVTETCCLFCFDIKTSKNNKTLRNHFINSCLLLVMSSCRVMNAFSDSLCLISGVSAAVCGIWGQKTVHHLQEISCRPISCCRKKKTLAGWCLCLTASSHFRRVLHFFHFVIWNKMKILALKSGTEEFLSLNRWTIKHKTKEISALRPVRGLVLKSWVTAVKVWQ